MGQAEILEILQSNYPKYMSYKEIKHQSTMSQAAVFRCLRSLSKLNEVQLKTVYGDKLRSNWKNLYRFDGGTKDE